MIARIALLILSLTLSAYVWVTDPGHVLHADTSAQVVYSATAHIHEGMRFNSQATLDTDQVDDLRHPLPTIGDCSKVDWSEVAPYDENTDGQIDCNSDVELGA